MQRVTSRAVVTTHVSADGNSFGESITSTTGRQSRPTDRTRDEVPYKDTLPHTQLCVCVCVCVCLSVCLCVASERSGRDDGFEVVYFATFKTNSF